jgi:hypothetical protein
VTPQEEQLLNSLAERVNQTQLQEKDPDAEALLTRELGGNQDALYILAQSVLVQNIALEQAKAQVNQLQQQVQQARQQPARATSFLGNLLGHRDPAPPQPTYLPPQQGYVPPPPPPPGYVDPQYQQQYASVGQPSFLRGAMQTAAGVAAGALAFEGVESILHGIGGFGHPGFGWGGGPGMGMGGFGMGPGMGMMGGGFERPVEETVINNNYYDQPGGGQEHFEHGGERGGIDQNVSAPFNEGGGQSDQGGAQFSDANYETSGDDQGGFDNGGSGFDNSGTDDGGSGFDDGGGGDSGGGFDGGGGDFS